MDWIDPSNEKKLVKVAATTEPLLIDIPNEMIDYQSGQPSSSHTSGSNFTNISSSRFGALKAIPTSASDLQKMAFRSDCQLFLSIILQKLIKPCSLKYKLVRGLSALQPSTICASITIAEERFNISLKMLYEVFKNQTSACHMKAKDHLTFEIAVDGKNWQSPNTRCPTFIKLHSTLLMPSTFYNIQELILTVFTPQNR
uniref:Uncharacterized protein n=1 Tax=Romanomermis culicivorax TaxID=13658 RepID=A0A915IU42_ROMCU